MSLVYDWEPLEDEVEILGHPRLLVRISATAPVAYLCAKLCDVFEDGTSALVTRGLLNLTHRESSEEPSPLEPNAWVTAELELEVTSWTFERGHRIRLDLSGTDWPNAWPPPAPVSLAIDRARSSLVLPVLRGPSPAEGRPDVRPPPTREGAVAAKEAREARDDGDSDDAGYAWRIERDVLAKETRAVVGNWGSTPAGGDHPPYRESYRGTVGVSNRDPGRAWSEADIEFEIAWPEATVSSRVHQRLTSDADAYELAIDLQVAEGGEPTWRRRWNRRFPRDLQ
jgi:hypothetical protein